MTTYFKTTQELIAEEAVRAIRPDRCPLPLSVIPNYIGINLCSVEGVEWTKDNDGQITSLTIKFIPAKEGEE